MALESRLRGILMYLAIAMAIALPMLPHNAWAIENYSGSVVAQCATTNGTITNVTATVTSPNWDVLGLTYTFQPGNHVLSGASGVDPNNNKIARFSLPPGTYTVTVSNPGLQATYTITVIDCTHPMGASLSVSKTVINTTGNSTSNIVFPVDVSCNHGAISTTLNLSSTGGYLQTVLNIPIVSICAIQEHAIAAPPGCHWNTTYPHGQSISLTHVLGYVIPVQNELVCASHCPPGKIEQTFPGTNIKFCCDHKLDRKSDAFCCKREIVLPTGKEEKVTPAPAKP